MDRYTDQLHNIQSQPKIDPNYFIISSKIDSSLPKALQDSLSGYKNVITIDGLEAKVLKATGDKKRPRKNRRLKRVNFVSILTDKWLPPPDDGFTQKSFEPNIDIYRKYELTSTLLSV